MNPFDKSPESKKNQDALNFEALIAKDRALIKRRLEEITIKMLSQDIPAEPNVGELEGVDSSDFSGLSGIKKKHDDNFPFLYMMPKNLFEYLNRKGGKKIRSLLLLNGYRTFSRDEEPSQEVIDAAVGIEILHETALILDDVIDNSTLRRGTPSLWWKNEELFKLVHLIRSTPLKGKEIATEFALLCFSWARHLMVDEVDAKIKPEVEKVFWQAVNDMKRGEEDDSRSAVTNEWPPIEHILEQFYLKTSSYSMRLPLLSALHASGAAIDGNILKGIEDFSRGFGIAFQLHDDLLITKTSGEIGKDSAIDAKNGTKIPVVILSRQLGNEEDIKFIDKVWGKPEELNQENLLKLQKIFKKTGAVRKIVEMIKLEIRKAESGLDTIEKQGFDVSTLRYLLGVGLPWMDDLDKRIDSVN